MDNFERRHNINNNNNNNNNNINHNAEIMQRGQEDLIRTAFEYTFPTNDNDDDNDGHDDDDDDDNCAEHESHKSTPYYTPMEFMATPFNFPSPKLTDNAGCDRTTSSASAANYCYCREDNNSKTHNDSAATNQSPRIIQASNKKYTTQTTTAAKHMEPTSPAIHLKFRRFSLYERRSCSPQHSIIKNAASMDCAMETDKENTKPKLRADHKDECNSGHNSPGVILDESGSPRILTNAEAAMLASGRLPYSPKLLNTINNLNLSSPLGVISSAGYKNGNYFKFPEIDQGLTLTSNHQSQADDIYDHIKIRPPSKKHNIGSLSPATLQQQPKAFTFDLNIEPKPKSGHDDGSTNINKPNTNTVGDKYKDTKRNRKNKNNLTIKIANSSLGSGQCTTNTTTTTNITLSTSRPKTPTIKSTKEKALSLDSAAAISELRRGTVNPPAALYASFDEMDSHMAETKPPICLEPLRASSLIKPRSTSMSQLSAATLHNRSNTNQSSYLVKNVRRRICTLNANEWQRQQNPFYESESLSSSKLLTKRVEDTKPVVYVQQEDEVINDKTALGTLAVPTMNSLNSIAAPTTAVRTSHKHNPLLHSSSTNLKTLPEFLTLVEFSTPTTLAVEQQQQQQHPFKQKSMDFPISTAAAAAATTSLPTGTRPPANVSSSTNLLQRRGSNHSLTLNLHGSCGNLLGNCRTGLSISNYNIGSMKNSSNNLNSKSSDNLNTSNGQVKLNIINSATTTTIDTETTSSALSDANQVTKQSIFLRRSSNNTLTNLAATSCGNLNSFSSQSSLNVDKPLPIMTLQRPSLTNTPRRGLLERRGSNQNLTLNTSSSFGGLSTERSILQQSRIHSFGYSETESEVEDDLKNPSGCHQNQRKFYSSENLNRTKTQFADLNQTHKRNANQVCFGSVADLKASDRDNPMQPIAKEPTPRSLQNFDFQETTVCTCTGVRNIQTKPLSPQTTSEEFKVYLANIQMLQNASNALNHIDLIKLNYIFDNSYTTAEFKSLTEQSISLLNVPPKGELDNASSSSSPSLATALLTHSNSEDCEIQERYLEVIRHILDSSQPDDEEQKRIFRNLHKEFWDLPLNHQEKPMVFGSQTKNRYKTILPNENSRVILEKESKLLQDMWLKVDANESDGVMMAEGDEHLPTMEEQPYINANYIKGPDYNSKCYIATQGPLPNTTYEFWLMIYQNTIKYMEICKGRENPSYRQGQALQQYYQKIIMLTNFTENNRQKCTIYLPIELNELLVVVNREEVLAPTTIVRAFLEDYLKVDDSENDDQPNIAMRNFQVKITEELLSCMPRANSFFAIKNVGIIKKRGFSTRKLIVLYCATATNTKQPLLLINRFYCYHYWYPDWPDHRSPQDINTLLDIALHVLNLGKCETEFDSFSSDKASPYANIMTQSVNLYQQDIFNAVQPLPVIHCSAGIGRTGCLTAILNGIRQVRQSLAYSLTSMAAAATKRATLDPALSPVDFCLPRTFLEQYASAIVLEEPLRLLQQQDIDCSFTRNTLLYLQYIIKMQQQQQQQQQSDASEEEGECASTTLPSLLDLSRMPNIFVDILGIVCNLRLQRGGMVQNSEQYELIHRAICLYLKRTFVLKRF